ACCLRVMRPSASMRSRRRVMLPLLASSRRASCEVLSPSSPARSRCASTSNRDSELPNCSRKRSDISCSRRLEHLSRNSQARSDFLLSLSAADSYRASMPLTAALCPGRSGIGQHRRRFDFHLRPRFHERAHLHHGHGGEILAHDLAVDPAHLAEPGEILLPVSDVPGHADDVFRTGAGLCQYFHGIDQGLADLVDEVVALEDLLAVPADLSCDEHEPPAGGDAIGIPLGLSPAGRLKNLHSSLLSWWLDGRRTLGAPPRNL